MGELLRHEIGDWSPRARLSSASSRCPPIRSRARWRCTGWAK
jgi:hypothetical protein